MGCHNPSIKPIRRTWLYNWVWRGIPWLLAGSLFVYLFTTSDWDGMLNVLNKTHFFSFFFVLLCYFIVQFVVDCFGIMYTLRQFNLYLPLTQIFAARGITSLFAIVHYSAGQGALPFYLYRTQHLSLWATSSAILFLTFVDLYWVVFLSFMGALGITGGSSPFLIIVAEYVLRIDLVLFMVLILYLFFWLVIIPRADNFFQPLRKTLVWLRQNPLCSTFRQASLRTYWRIALVRMPVHLSMVFFSFLALKTFTPEVPPRAFILVYPLTLLIGTLPITPAGLGTTQIAIVELLKDIASREALLAYSMIWAFGILALKFLLGVYYLYRRFVSKEG